MNKTEKKAPPTEEELGDMSIEELNEHASEFDWDDAEEITPAPPRKLDAAISVRFNSEELAKLRDLADTFGMKVTAFIRAVTLEHATKHERVVDREKVEQALAVLIEQLGPPNTALMTAMACSRIQPGVLAQDLPPGGAWVAWINGTDTT